MSELTDYEKLQGVYAQQDQIAKLIKERDELAAKVAEMREAIDRIYNHNEAARAAVIHCYGLHHKPDRCGTGWRSPEDFQKAVADIMEKERHEQARLIGERDAEKEKTKALVGALTRIEDFAKVADHPKAFDFETFQMLEANLAEVLKWAKKALAACKEETR